MERTGDWEMKEQTPKIREGALPCSGDLPCIRSIQTTQKIFTRLTASAVPSQGRCQAVFTFPLGFRPFSTVIAIVPISVLLIIAVLAPVTLPVNIDVVQGDPKDARSGPVKQ